MKAIEDHEDVLQNLEFSILSVRKDFPGLVDYDVLQALDALLDLYRAEARGHLPKPVSLQDPKELLIFQRVKKVCEWRLGREPLEEDDPDLECETGTTKTVKDIFDCLQRVRKSVSKWNKERGPQGYLDFVARFLQ